jgi:DNA damage-binding protein 1
MGGYRIVRELTLLSLSFMSSPSSDPLLAIIHIDHLCRTQLLARSLLISRDQKKHVLDISLSPTPSPILLSTALSVELFPVVDENPPKLIPVEEGVLVVGGRKILLYGFAPKRKQDKAIGKHTRLEAKKASGNIEEKEKAREKEKERDDKERKADWAVEWAWGEVVAWVTVSFGFGIPMYDWV